MAINVRDAMPDGGKLLIESANAELDHSYARRHPEVTPGRYVMLTVTDKIYLPRVDEVEDRGQAAEPQGQSIADSETILLVEDEEPVRALAAEVLRECGHNVLASTPEDALQASERHTEPIHLLPTDVVMPRLSGRKIADLLPPPRGSR